MAITNYTELQAAVVSWSHRADLGSVIPDFITLAENKFNRNLRTLDMEAISTLTPTNGVCALPSDWLEVRRLYINSDTLYELEYVTPEQFYVKFPLTGTASPDKSRYYTIQGNNLYLSDKQNTQDVSILYYQKVPTLLTNATNWLLTDHPDLYLSATMAELSDFIKDANGVQKWNAKAQAIVDSISMSDKKGKYSGSALRVISA